MVMIWGWALQAYPKVGHCRERDGTGRDTLGAAGIFCGWALQTSVLWGWAAAGKFWPEQL